MIDPARYARQPDPDCNHLPRRWTEPADLDREADRELQAGRHLAAERLAHQAAEMRQTGGDRWARAVPR